MTESAAPLTHPDGRAARIALLLYGSPDHDSRVLKSAASLRDAGADVLIVARSIVHSGAAEGHGLVGAELPVYRTQDLDLTRTLPGLTKLWRTLRQQRTPAQSTATPSAPAPTDATSPPAPPQTAATLSPRAKIGVPPVVADVYMRGYDVARIVRYWGEAVRVTARFRPDVVHANDGNTLAPALALQLLRGSSIVYDSHELWTKRSVLKHRWLAPRVEAAIERIGVRRASAVITVSGSIAVWMQRRFRLRQRPLVVRNIPHRAGPVPSPTHGRLRELAGLSEQDQVIAYCGGIAGGRGIEETIAALVQLPPRVHLVLLGSGNPRYLDTLLALAADLGVADRIHQAGRVPSSEVSTALADADCSVVFLHPVNLNHTYALPNKLFETIHAGVPVVAANLPDIADVVQSTGAGELFAVAEPGALAAAVLKVLSDPSRYRTAARLAAEHLDWQYEAPRLIGAHRAAVRGSRA